MMKRIMILLALWTIGANAYAGNINHVVFFGDSLTDTGNLHTIIPSVPKSEYYYKGRFSNGPIWSDNFERYLFEHFYIDSHNFAYAGATSISHDFTTKRIILPVTFSGVGGELDMYYLASTNFPQITDRSDVLFSIWIGANDYLFEKADPNKSADADVDDLTTAVVDGISSGINSLIRSGAQYFLVVNLPDLARTPYAINNGLVERLHSISLRHNEKLLDAINLIRTVNPTVKIAYLDIYKEFTGLMDHTEDYNKMYNLSITNIRDACLPPEESFFNFQTDKFKQQEWLNNINADLTKNMTLNKSLDKSALSEYILHSPDIFNAYTTGLALAEGKTAPCDNPKDHIFWDDVHPSYHIHKVIAKLALSSLTDAGLSFI